MVQPVFPAAVRAMLPAVYRAAVQALLPAAARAVLLAAFRVVWDPVGNRPAVGAPASLAGTPAAPGQALCWAPRAIQGAAVPAGPACRQGRLADAGRRPAFRRRRAP